MPSASSLIGFTAASTDADALLKACRQAQSATQFRELLDFDFAPFNESLVATGSEPLTYPAVHASQLLNHIVDHETSILEALRNAAAPTLDTFTPAPDYAQRRDGLRAMKTDPTWLALYHFVPESVLDDYIARWLENSGAPAAGANPHGLRDLAEVRSVNLTAIGRFATAAKLAVPRKRVRSEREMGRQRRRHTELFERDLGILARRPGRGRKEERGFDLLALAPSTSDTGKLAIRLDVAAAGANRAIVAKDYAQAGERLGPFFHERGEIPVERGPMACRRAFTRTQGACDLCRNTNLEPAAHVCSATKMSSAWRER